MEFENLLKLINTVSESELTQFSYKENGSSISMKKEKNVLQINSITDENKDSLSVLPNIEISKAALTDEKILHQEEGNVIKSPLVGTFYSAPEPEAEPFIKVGDSVSKGQVLGIIEAMKLMNEIESDYEGVVKQILVSNEDVIEFGQPLFVIG